VCAENETLSFANNHKNYIDITSPVPTADFGMDWSMRMATMLN